MKELCNSKVHYLEAQACKKGNRSKNGRFVYEIIDEAKPEMEFLEVVRAAEKVAGGQITTSNSPQLLSTP